MGYLTTITVYNDGIHDLRDHAQEFADRVYDAAVHSCGMHPVDVRIGSFCNFGKVQKPRHADDHTVYVHAGNTVCEMNAFSEETRKIMRQSPKFFEKLMKEMRTQYRELRRLQKESATGCLDG